MANIVNFILNLQSNVGAGLNRAAASIRNFIGQTGGASSALGGLGSAALGVGGVLAGVFAVDKIAEFGKSIITAGADMETTRVRFEALAGSADIANDAIKRISALATKTPFSKTDLLGYGQQLIGAGLSTDEMAKKLSTLGNISSATGKNLGELTSLYVKNKGNGLIQGEDLNQLADAKIPLDAFAKQLGTNVQGLRKLGSQGKLTFGDLDKYFESLGGAQGKWGNMNEKLSNTLSGRWSNFQDTIEQMISDLGEAKLPIFGSILTKMTEVVEWVASHKDKIADLFKPIMRTFQPVINLFKEVSKQMGLTSDVTKILDGAISGLQYVMDALASVLEPVYRILTKLIGTLINVFGTLFAWYDKFITKVTGFNVGELIRIQFNGIAIFFESIADTMDLFGKNFDRVMNNIKGGWAALKSGSPVEGIKKVLADNAAAEKAIDAQKSRNVEKYKRMLVAGIRGNKTEGEAERDKDNEKESALEKMRKAAQDKAAKGGATTKETKMDTKVGNVAGTKPTTINLHIDKIVGQQIDHQTNMTVKEALAGMKEALIQELTTAINDTMRLANS